MPDPVGKTEGANCGRRIGQWGNTRICAGHIVHQGAGQDADGRSHRFIGCDGCGWVLREALPEPVTESLFGEGA